MRTSKAAVGDITKGAAAGVGLAILFLGVGLARAAIYVLGGGRLQWPSPAELRPALFYVGGFAAAGAVLGALRPLLRSKPRVYMACMAGATVVMLTIVLSDKGRLSAIEPSDWWFIVAAGAAFGSAGAYGWFRNGP